MDNLLTTLSESMQMYLVTIARLSTDNQPVPLSKLAEELDISPVSVNEMCRKLQENGLINYQPYKGASLTPEGSEKACFILRRHDLWEVFLVDKLGFDVPEAHDIACHLEHIPSNILVDRLDAYLDYPVLNPSGVIIPGSGNRKNIDMSVPLDSLSAGQTARVVRFKLDENTLSYLNQSGVHTGIQIKVLAESAEGILVQYRGTNILSLSRELSKNIFVVRTEFEINEINNLSPENNITQIKETPTMVNQQTKKTDGKLIQRKTLTDLRVGQSGVVVKVGGKGQIRQRMMDMGVVPGSEIKVIRIAPLGDPVEFSIKGYNLSLRKSEAGDIEVEVSE